MTEPMRWALVAAGLAFAMPALGRDIHYGAVTDPAILECDRLHWRGDTRDASQCYAELMRDEMPASIKAEASWALNNLQQANEWFRAALAERPDDHASKVRWGDLFAATHQGGEAMNIYREVLADDPNNAFAMLGAARVLVERFEDAATAYIQPLVDGQVYDQGALLGAWLLLARVALESGVYYEAETALHEAETLVERNGWPPLEIYALRASLELLKNSDPGEWTERALEYNPGWGRIYALPAHFYVITRRYRAAIDLYQQAIDIEPGLASAHEDIGINLLRDNQMTRARSHLEKAHELDPFSPRAVNTLRLMDSYVDFRLISDEPGDAGGVPVILRLHHDEAAAIAPYAVPLIRDSIELFSKRYDYELREPVVVEMYPDHEDFAVRTAGMPGLGILGATFGYVIAMDSPSGRPPQEFQWGTTLWHEMAHIFTLEATDHLVPRWYSEGISMFEEWRSGPNPGVHIPMSVYEAMRDDRFLSIADLDEGFIRPSYPEQVIVSYMQAGLVCDFIDRRYGSDKLRELLVAFRDGLLTEAAINRVLDLGPDDFDDAFEDYVAAEHGQVVDNLDRWQRGQERYREAMAEKDWTTAIDVATALIEILPQYVEPDSPYLAAAVSHRELGNTEAAMDLMQAYWKNGGYDPAPLRRYADWLLESGREGEAIAVLDSINLVDPLDADLHGELGDLLLASGRAGEALREYEVALALQPHDMAAAWYRLGNAEYSLGNNAKAEEHILQSLDLAPHYRPAQRLLLQLSAERTDE